MRKLIAVMNMTLDGFCDHTSMIADEEIHDHYTDLLRSADTILYGRITYQLMEDFWPGIVKNPTGNKSLDDFAVAIDNIRKVVLSRTLKHVSWNTATLTNGDLPEIVAELRQKAGGDIYVGSPGLIASLLNLDLIDELQLCVQPIVAGQGLKLFKNIDHRIRLNLMKTKTLASSGSVVFYYTVNRMDTGDSR